jgi:hypothetical protein
MRARAGASGIRRIRGGLAGARPWTALAVVAAWLVTAATTLGADPTASPAGGDVRTTPAAPGLAGEPLLALAGVLVVGLLAAGITLLAVRMTSRP